MNEQELKLLRNEVTDAAESLERALSDAQCALENMEEFHASETVAQEQFDWIIKTGFIPGARFKINREKSPLSATVVSYTYINGKRSGAGVVFEYEQDGKTQQTTCFYNSLRKYLNKFTEAGHE